MNIKFQNFKNFTLLFPNETFSSGRELPSKKGTTKCKIDSVRNSDSDSDKKVDSDKQGKQGKIDSRKKCMYTYIYIYYI